MFLDSNSYGDAIRNAIYLGGDSDTLACITGGIAESYNGDIPESMRDKGATAFVAGPAAGGRRIL